MNFEEKLKNGKFVTLLESIPPKGTDFKNILNELEKVKDKVDAITVVDSPLSDPRMHPIALCHTIEKKVKKETVMHFTCRDRNRIEIEAILLAARSLGVRNILALTGDPCIPRAKPVFEFSSVGLIEFIHGLNRKYKTNFFIGCGMNINVISLENEIKRTEKKIKAGAEFVITQPCFDVDLAEKILERLNIPVIIGVLIVFNKKIAQFVDSKIPGIKIPGIFYNLNHEDVLDYYKKLIHEMKKVCVHGICLMPMKENYIFIRKLIETKKKES